MMSGVVRPSEFSICEITIRDHFIVTFLIQSINTIQLAIWHHTADFLYFDTCLLKNIYVCENVRQSFTRTFQGNMKRIFILFCFIWKTRREGQRESGREVGREIEREKEIFHPLVYNPDAHKNQAWHTPNSDTEMQFRSFMWVVETQVFKSSSPVASQGLH